MKGHFFIIMTEFKARCCSRVFYVGQVLKVTDEPSPNRLYITEENCAGHNVKRSTFLRCCTPKDCDFGAPVNGCKGCPDCMGIVGGAL